MAEGLTEKKVIPTGNFIPKGKSGTLVTAFEVQDEYLEELQGILGQIEFDKMDRSDSQVRKLVHAVNNPIKSANWDIEPASDEKKDIDAAALMKHILFEDIIGGWKSKLDEILEFPWKGHAVLEVVHKNRTHPTFGNYTGLLNLAWRDPRTLDKWEFTNEGELLRIHQLQQGDIDVNEWMDVKNLLIFYNEKKGSNTGFPFLRMIYGNYKRKLLYKQLQAIGIERAALPVPHLELPEGVQQDSEEATNAEEQLAAFSQAENAYFITPFGYKLTLGTTSTFDPSKVQTAIKAENEEIVGSLVGMWLEMGIGGNSGNQAGTSISAEVFRDGIEYLADKIVDKINLELIPNLMLLNFGDTFDVLPKLAHSGIADEAGKELMEVVTGYTKEGLITPDEQLEDFLRKAHNLPDKQEGTILDNKGTKDDNSSTDESDDQNTDHNNNKDEEIVELSVHKHKTARALIQDQAIKVSDDIRRGLRFSADKYINDVMNRYKQLPDAKKQNATKKVKIGGQAQLKKDLKRTLTETTNKSLTQVRREVPGKGAVQLRTTEKDLIRLDIKPESINLNKHLVIPTHATVLIARQSELIGEASITDLRERLDFTFSSIETKVTGEDVIRQKLDDSADTFIESASINTKGVNAAAMMVNEGRNSFFFNEEVLEEIHSFTFVNIAPVSAICKELAETTFKTNDAESLRFHPPLHHNCKSYLRANLKTSKGIDSLEVSKLAPSADAQKSITL